MAAERVAAGVWPPGDFQYPLAAICSIISRQRSGCFDSESSLAAASKALIFCGAFLVAAFPPPAGLEGAFFAAGVLVEAFFAGACFREIAFFFEVVFLAAIVFPLS